MTHDLYVCLLKPCSAAFAVQRGVLTVWRAERQLDVVGWMFGYIEVWALFDVFFFSPQKVCLDNKVRRLTESAEPPLCN